MFLAFTLHVVLTSGLGRVSCDFTYHNTGRAYGISTGLYAYVIRLVKGHEFSTVIEHVYTLVWHEFKHLVLSSSDSACSSSSRVVLANTRRRNRGRDIAGSILYTIF